MMGVSLTNFFKESTIEIGEYSLNNPEEIDTPAFLVFEELVEHNLKEIIRVCGSPQRLVSHVKTHKSSAILKKQIEITVL